MIKKLLLGVSLLTCIYNAEGIPNPGIIKREQLEKTTEKILQFRLCRCHKKSPQKVQEFLQEVAAWENAFEQSEPFLADSDVKTLAQALSSHAKNPYTKKTKAEFKQARKELTARLKELKRQEEKSNKTGICGDTSGMHAELLEEYALPVLKAFE